ncbi:helix-turn-helix domain-containing protein [Streptomyces sp. NPDC002054]|uniref:helix-turn-helix domain-containing protein n=1 Tax=Streptomyces sp. NPDC002054 TaxID=3154663 RepID=UPI003332B731
MKHTSRFTVVGNHLAQHPELSLMARGLALYIQSLPTGARIGIKDLAARCPETEYRIARALRELEAYGYLERSRVRLDDGRVVTRTVSYNRPGVLPETVTETEPPPRPEPRPEPEPEPRLEPRPEPEPEPGPGPEGEPPPPGKESVPGPGASAPRAGGGLPKPDGPHNPARRRAAEGLLARLRRVDPRLLLGARDIEWLAPGVEAWFERGATADAVTVALTANLLPQPRNPAGLIAHRLTVQLPPGLPPSPRAAPFVPPDPMQNCDHCDRGFRAPAPGRCGDCRTGGEEAA